MLSTKAKAIVVPGLTWDDDDRLVCNKCFTNNISNGRYVRTVVQSDIADNTQCQGCHKYLGPFTVEAPLPEAEYHELARKLRHLDPEDLINLISLTLAHRGDVKQPDVVGTSEGHYEQASILNYKPESVPGERPYPQRAFEIVVMERNTANIPAHLLSI